MQTTSLGMLVQLNVALDSPARAYTLGVPSNGQLEDDPTFFLFSTSGVTKEHSIFGNDLQTTNWIGYVAIGPNGKYGRDIAVAFRGTQVRARQRGTRLETVLRSSKRGVPQGAPTLMQCLGLGRMRRQTEMSAAGTMLMQSGGAQSPCRLRACPQRACCVTSVARAWRASYHRVAAGCPGGQERPRPNMKAVPRQAWSEWLSDARGLFEMQPWSDEAQLLVGGGGRVFPWGDIVPRELGDDTPVTKTEPPAVDGAVLKLGTVKIGEGFEKMYRDFAKTPGNTLSLQARCSPLMW